MSPEKKNVPPPLASLATTTGSRGFFEEWSNQVGGKKPGDRSKFHVSTPIPRDIRKDDVRAEHSRNKQSNVFSLRRLPGRRKNVREVS
jgi:hypothetical protein